VNSISPTFMTRRLPAASGSSRCAILGHKVHHTEVTQGSSAPCVRCGAAILDSGPTVSRVAHTLSCFFGSHHYVAVATRESHNEYVCDRCGHPLLFEFARDPYATQNNFNKKVNYACGLFGHRVHVVAATSNTTEYACRCGHSFIREERALNVIRHPLSCVMFGHLVRINQIRGEWAEYVCVRCGHPFCFKLAAGSTQEPNQEQRQHV
jgi:DNA-directed RNA polymerase subunit RPC12/RpoP